MESLPFLCRFQYDQSCPYICNKLDPLMEAFAKCKICSLLNDNDTTNPCFMLKRLHRESERYSSFDMQERSQKVDLSHTHDILLPSQNPLL